MAALGDTPEEVFAQIGVHLLLVQDFEFLLRFTVRIALRDRSEVTIDALTDDDRRTMGQFIRDLRKDAALHTDLDALLKQVLDDRNLFAHALRQQTWFDTTTTEGRDRIWAWFARAQPRLEEAIMIFTAFAVSYAKQTGFSGDLSKMPWVGDFYSELTKTYIPRVGTLIAKKGQSVPGPMRSARG